MPSAPALQMSHFGRARRFSLWFLALLFHTTNALLYVLKMEEDRWCLLMKDTGLGITLIFCIGLVILLHQSFAVTKVRYLINLIYMTSCFSIVQYNKMACCVGCLDLLCHFRFPLCGNCSSNAIQDSHLVWYCAGTDSYCYHCLYEHFTLQLPGLIISIWLYFVVIYYL